MFTIVNYDQDLKKTFIAVRGTPSIPYNQPVISVIQDEKFMIVTFGEDSHISLGEEVRLPKCKCTE